MNLVISLICWILKLLQQWIQQRQEGVNGWETWDGGVSWKVNHSLLNILICDIFSGWLIILILIQHV